MAYALEEPDSILRRLVSLLQDSSCCRSSPTEAAASNGKSVLWEDLPGGSDLVLRSLPKLGVWCTPVIPAFGQCRQAAQLKATVFIKTQENSKQTRHSPGGRRNSFVDCTTPHLCSCPGVPINMAPTGCMYSGTSHLPWPTATISKAPPSVLPASDFPQTWLLCSPQCQVPCCFCTELYFTQPLSTRGPRPLATQGCTYVEARGGRPIS